MCILEKGNSQVGNANIVYTYSDICKNTFYWGINTIYLIEERIG